MAMTGWCFLMRRNLRSCILGITIPWLIINQMIRIWRWPWIMQNDLKCRLYCIKGVNTANKVLGMNRRSFVCKDREIILQLYKSLVRPHLEYCVQAWRPHLQKDIDLIEGVQWRATKITKMIPILKNKSYEERLNIVKVLTSLKLACFLRLVQHQLEGIIWNELSLDVI